MRSVIVHLNLSTDLNSTTTLSVCSVLLLLLCLLAFFSKDTGKIALTRREWIDLGDVTCILWDAAIGSLASPARLQPSNNDDESPRHDSHRSHGAMAAYSFLADEMIPSRHPFLSIRSVQNHLFPAKSTTRSRGSGTNGLVFCTVLCGRKAAAPAALLCL
jgi:hypothetical protein